MTGAAQRRKQRRLRSWWRHEQQSIAAALATGTKFRTRPLPQAAGTVYFAMDVDDVLAASSQPDQFKVSRCLVGSVGVWTVMVTFLGECPFPLLVEIREYLEFHGLVEMDKSSWSRCLLWHGWLPLLSRVNMGAPWVASPRQGACNLLECALGRYSSDALTEWQLPVGFDAEGAARRVAVESDVWIDGSLVEDKVSGASSVGAGCFTFRCNRLWANWRWCHLDEDVGEGVVVSVCRGFSSVPGPLQSVQRAEFWALQADDGVHLGVDNLGLYGMLAVSWMARLLLVPLSWLRMGILFCLLRGCSVFGGWTRFVFLRWKVMLMRPWFVLEALVNLIGWVIMEQVRLQILVVGGYLGGLLMFGEILLGFVGLYMLFEIGPFFLGLLGFGMGSGALL